MTKILMSSLNLPTQTTPNTWWAPYLKEFYTNIFKASLHIKLCMHHSVWLYVKLGRSEGVAKTVDQAEPMQTLFASVLHFTTNKSHAKNDKVHFQPFGPCLYWPSTPVWFVGIPSMICQYSQSMRSGIPCNCQLNICLIKKDKKRIPLKSPCRYQMQWRHNDTVYVTQMERSDSK